VNSVANGASKSDPAACAARALGKKSQSASVIADFARIELEAFTAALQNSVSDGGDLAHERLTAGNFVRQEKVRLHQDRWDQIRTADACVAILRIKDHRYATLLRGTHEARRSGPRQFAIPGTVRHSRKFQDCFARPVVLGREQPMKKVSLIFLLAFLGVRFPRAAP
jgi:hypothetical protein